MSRQTLKRLCDDRRFALIAAILAVFLLANAMASSFYGQAWVRPAKGATDVTPAPDATPQKPRPLKIFSHSPANHPERVLLTAVIEAWNRLHPHMPAMLMPPPQNIYDNPLADYFAATASERPKLAQNMPDLLDFYGNNFAFFAAHNGLHPLEKFLPKEVLATIRPFFLNLGKYPPAGSVYSVPLQATGLALWARKSALDAAHIRIPKTPAEAWDKAEFDAALTKLKSLPGVSYPLDVGWTAKNETGIWYDFAFTPWLLMAGNIFDDSTQRTKGLLDGDKSVAIMTYLQSLATRQLIAPPAAARDEAHPLNKIPLLYAGPWLANILAKAHGKDLVLLPLPQLGENKATARSSWGFGISKTSPHPQNAAKFLAFLLQPRHLADFSNRLSGIPTSDDALRYTDNYKPGKRLRLFRDQFSGPNRSDPVFPNYAVFSNELVNAIGQILNGGDVQQILSNAASNIDKASEAHDNSQEAAMQK
ncbi:MAG: extracellular solute-binding protein [Candidatus Symbiobacter sp.]|nr:extracellular solute-binding protein [Candidatus Symbiobacter sp.]